MKGTYIRPFIPSMDFEISKQFYIDLGFKITYEEEKMIILTLGDVSFFLQAYYNEDWAHNTMVQLFVEDLDGFFELAKNVKEKFDNIRLKEPFQAHYGKTFHLIDPAGVLWHVMQSK